MLRHFHVFKYVKMLHMQCANWLFHAARYHTMHTFTILLYLITIHLIKCFKRSWWSFCRPPNHWVMGNVHCALALADGILRCFTGTTVLDMALFFRSTFFLNDSFLLFLSSSPVVTKEQNEIVFLHPLMAPFSLVGAVWSEPLYLHY